MERLNFNESGAYEGIEAAVHIARYSFAKHCCVGKKVLDIACGEGYGSRLLANWGAESVVGVDVSDEAIANAQRYFSNDRVTFEKGTAESITEQFAPQSFDLIVSFETIEHVHDPVLFLRNMKALLKPGGIIAISCPNDWWYFPTVEQRNPYHLRKYHFEEFRAETEGVLGPADAWFLGGPIFGFANMQHGGYLAADGISGQIQMQKTSAALEAHFVPAEFEAGPMPENASYFLGIWGAQDYVRTTNAGTAILPLSMDSFKTGIFKGHLPQKGEQVVYAAASTDGVAGPGDGIEAYESLTRSVRDFSLKVEVAVGELGLIREHAAENSMSPELHAVANRVRTDAVEMQRSLAAFRPQLHFQAKREDERNKALDEVQALRAEIERMFAQLGIPEMEINAGAESWRKHDLIKRTAVEAARYRKITSLMPDWLRGLLMSLNRKLRHGKQE
ncbi:methyltransferase domain-containing protein [Achromobacter kerstersii]